MADTDWLDYLAERDEYNPFTPDELPRQWRDAYTDSTGSQDWEEAA